MGESKPPSNDAIKKLKTKIKELKKELQHELARRPVFPGLGSLLTKIGITEQDKVSSFKLRRHLKGHFGKVYAMDWAGNGREIVSASQDGKLIIWDAMLNAKLHAIPLRSAWVMTCAFEQENNEFVACGGLDNLCSIYRISGEDVPITRTYREFSGHDGYLSSCKFIGPQRILTASGDATSILWDIETGQDLQKMVGHEQDVMCVSVLPQIDPNIFVSGSCDCTTKVWDVRTGKAQITLRGHDSDINAVSLFPDGKAIGTGSDDASCRIFDLRAVAEDKILCGITSVAFSKAGRMLIAGYDDYSCNVWDVLGSQSQPTQVLGGHDNRVSCLSVSPKGDAFCTGSWDTMLRVWA